MHADVRPGREARFDSEYERRGTANVFRAVEPKAGRHFSFATSNRCGVEFAKALFELALAYPEAETIHLATDNLSAHGRKSLTELCGEEFDSEIWACFTPHYTLPPGTAASTATRSKSTGSSIAERRVGRLATKTNYQAVRP